MKTIVFDTETSGLPKNYKAHPSDTDNWPRIIEIAWVVIDEESGEEVYHKSTLIKPVGFVIPEEATKVHHISMDMASMMGLPVEQVIPEFITDLEKCYRMVGHNILFDLNVIESEIYRMGMKWTGVRPEKVDTMIVGTEFCKIPGKFSGYKWPKLEELYSKLFGAEIQDAHSSLGDVRSTAKCYLELKKLGVIR